MDTKSALWRSKHPRSWPWSIDTEFLSAILFTVQGANWQRSGGKGEKPKYIKRPNDIQLPVDIEQWDIKAKKAALDAEVERRRARRDAKARRTGKVRKSKMIDRTPAKQEDGFIPSLLASDEDRAVKPRLPN